VRCAAHRAGAGLGDPANVMCQLYVVSCRSCGVCLFVARRHSVSAHSMQRCTLHGVSCGRLHTDLRCGRLHSTQRDRPPHPPAHVRRVQVGRCPGVYPPSRCRPLHVRLCLPPSLRCDAHPSTPARCSGSRQARSSRSPRRRRRFSCSRTSSSCSTPPIACCSASRRRSAPIPLAARMRRVSQHCNAARPRMQRTLQWSSARPTHDSRFLVVLRMTASIRRRLRSHAGLSGHGGRLSGEDIARYACAARGPALAAPEALPRLRDSRQPGLLSSCLF
jgi:hypothetical protein